MKSWCLLLTGLPNSGKSTLAYNLVQECVRNALVIDGDKHREMQFLGEKLGFTKEDIMRNTEHVIKLAKFAQDQEINVLISQIAPYRDQRQIMRKELNDFYEVFCTCDTKIRENRPNFKDSELIYELGGYDLIMYTDINNIKESINIIKQNWGKIK